MRQHHRRGTSQSFWIFKMNLARVSLHPQNSIKFIFVKPFPFQCPVISQVAVKLHNILTKLIIPECNNLELVDNQYSNLPSK